MLPKNKNDIRAYEKGRPVKLSFNFYSTEFDCKCERLECQITLIDLLLVKKLQWIRSALGPVQINRGFSCQAHNKEVGGVEKSQHLEGTAADIDLQKIKPHCLQDLLIEKQLQLVLTVGRYDTFTHIDTRIVPIVFDKRAESK